MRQETLQFLRAIDGMTEPAAAALIAEAAGLAQVTTRVKLAELRKLRIVRFTRNGHTYRYALSERGKAILRKHAGENDERSITA